MKIVWYSYIITNFTNTVLYVGHTNNLDRRIHEHIKGIGSHFPKRYRLYKLIWYEEFSTSLESARMERKLKGLTREKKINLILQTNPKYRDLLISLH